MSAKPPSNDTRNLVDRWLERVKNNRIAALIIIIGIGLSALAGLTDTLKKLSDLRLPSSRIEVSGEWRSTPTDLYGAGPQVLVLKLSEPIAGRLTGSVRFLDLDGKPRTPEFEIMEGKREGNRITFAFDGGARSNRSSDGRPVPLKETAYGEASGNEIRFVYEREGQGGVPFVVKRASAVLTRPDPSSNPGLAR